MRVYLTFKPSTNKFCLRMHPDVFFSSSTDFIISSWFSHDILTTWRLFTSKRWLSFGNWTSRTWWNLQPLQPRAPSLHRTMWMSSIIAVRPRIAGQQPNGRTCRKSSAVRFVVARTSWTKLEKAVFGNKLSLLVRFVNSVWRILSRVHDDFTAMNKVRNRFETLRTSYYVSRNNWINVAWPVLFNRSGRSTIGWTTCRLTCRYLIGAFARFILAMLLLFKFSASCCANGECWLELLMNWTKLWSATQRRWMTDWGWPQVTSSTAKRLYARAFCIILKQPRRHCEITKVWKFTPGSSTISSVSAEQ